MKREGRQHGMVRTCRILPAPLNPRPESKFGQRLNSPPTAGLFTKVPSKPTNHSKFTGKCDRARCLECHMHPTSKSRDKTKGTQKLRSTGDVATDYRLVSMRVVYGPPGFKVHGLSATEMLDDLSSNSCEDYESCDDDGDNYNREDGLVADSWTLMEQEIHKNENDGAVDLGSGLASDQWEEDKDWHFVGEI